MAPGDIAALIFVGIPAGIAVLGLTATTVCFFYVMCRDLLRGNYDE